MCEDKVKSPFWWKPYMHTRHSQHEKTKLLPHFEPVVQPLRKAAVLRAAPQLHIGRDQTCAVRVWMVKL